MPAVETARSDYETEIKGKKTTTLAGSIDGGRRNRGRGPQRTRPRLSDSRHGSILSLFRMPHEGMV